jgi:hypothetical protein
MEEVEALLSQNFRVQEPALQLRVLTLSFWLLEAVVQRHFHTAHIVTLHLTVKALMLI